MAQLGKSRDARTRVAKPQGSRPQEAEDRFAALGDRKPPDPLAFWRTKTLEEMTRDEWESLCDGCGRCCLLKLQDEDTDEIYVTRVSCRLLDVKSCQCIDYSNRFDHVPDCVTIDAAKVRTLPWLPETCASRRVAEGHDLEWWHPLVSGSPDTVHEAGISVRGLARSEAKINENDLWRYIIDPPGEAK
jgi:uncharacterized cysteine cluster protein YcgN (CxxCxxCC family)